VRLAYETLTTRLREAGLSEGDVVMVQSSLKHIGPVAGKDTRESLVDFYYRAFRDVIGSKGTLVVHTPFEDYGRIGTPFDVKHSPSTAGILSEYVRTLTDTVRSPHPIVSVAANGPRAEEICGGDHFEGFGWDSPWGRMHRMNAKFVTLGLGLAFGLSLLHYIEASYGVPYAYVKIFNTPVSRGGDLINGLFTMSVRYLNFGIRYDYRRYEQYMLTNDLAHSFNFERGLLFQITDGENAFNGGVECLRKNRYTFLDNPPRFRQGEIPYDGQTGSMDRSSKPEPIGVAPL